MRSSNSSFAVEGPWPGRGIGTRPSSIGMGGGAGTPGGMEVAGPEVFSEVGLMELAAALTPAREESMGATREACCGVSMLVDVGAEGSNESAAVDEVDDEDDDDDDDDEEEDVWRAPVPSVLVLDVALEAARA